jgi:hypothetical protein
MLVSLVIAGCGGTVIDPGGAGGSGGGGGSGGASGDASVPTNPLEGTWTYSESGGTTEFKVAITFSGDGSGNETLMLSSCTGSETVGGISWTWTATTITLTGNPSCSGSLECGGAGDMPCSTTPVGAIQSTCAYLLSNGSDTLTLSDCSESSGPPETSSIVLTRQ